MSLFYWNNFPETKQFTTDFQLAAFSRCVPQTSLIADIGCGYGRTLAELHQNGYTNLIGFDISHALLRRGKCAFPYLDLRRMTEGKIPLPDETADAVILLAVLTCIPSDEKQEELIREIARILKPGAILYVNDFLLNQDERTLARYEKYKTLNGTYGVFRLPEGVILRHHSEERIQKLLSPFTPKEYRRLTFRTMNGHTSNGFYAIIRKTENTAPSTTLPIKGE